jgi:F-type H+-transporting ATPase subunit delta
MKTSKQAAREAKQLFRLCVSNGLLDEGRVRQVVERVIRSQYRGYLAVLSRFRRLLKLEQERHLAEVESATPLPADLRASVEAGLERLYGPGIDIQFAIRPSLIGGIRVKVGSDVYDGSVKSELAALERSF